MIKTSGKKQLMKNYKICKKLNIFKIKKLGVNIISSR